MEPLEPLLVPAGLPAITGRPLPETPALLQADCPRCLLPTRWYKYWLAYGRGTDVYGCGNCGLNAHVKAA